MPKPGATVPKRATASSRPNDKAQDYSAIFKALGVRFDGGSEQAHAEECPFCGGEKFYVSRKTGQYKCLRASCGESGNAYTFINRMHAMLVEATTDQDLHPLRDKRRLPVQTLRRHGIVWSAAAGCYLIPFLSGEKRVQNILRYWLRTGDKRALPILPWRLYGLDTLSPEVGRALFVCEGPFDAIALDQHLRSGKKTRERYDVLAVPSTTVFFPDWLKHFDGRKVRLLFDNDKAGRDGQERIAKLCRDRKTACQLSALYWPPRYPEKCDITDLIHDGVNVAQFARNNCHKVAVAERRLVFTRGDAIEDESVEWMDELHIPFGTFVSFSGDIGTQKSAICRDLAARGTAGLKMPGSGKAIAPFDVIYFTSEDPKARVKDLVKVHGGDLTRLQVYDIAESDEPIDLLQYLPSLETEINTRKVRLVIVDALNSFVGGDISTDSKARRSLSGPLGALARRTGACIIGIRNFNRASEGTSSQRSLGALSLSHVSRCAMNTSEVKGKEKVPKGERKFQLEFERVTDAPKPAPLVYRVKDLATGKSDSHLRRIVWEKEEVEPIARTIRAGTFPRRKAAKP
jgi:hypothetical protein